MICAICHTSGDRVIDSRLDKSGQVVRRRRECLNCQHRWTTYELTEAAFESAVAAKLPEQDQARTVALCGALRAILEQAEEFVAENHALPFKGFRGKHPVDVRRIPSAKPPSP